MGGALGDTMAASATRSLAAGGSAILSVPDYRDQEQLVAALRAVLPADRIVHLDARQSNPDRYRALLACLGDTPLAIVGNRSVLYAPAVTLGLIAVWDEGRQHLTFHVGNQVPHPYRTTLAGRLRLSESQVTVISQDVGGGFGQKIALYREELTVAAIARHLKRPVRWREDRLENLLSSSQAREDFCRTRAAVSAQGQLLSLAL